MSWRLIEADCVEAMRELPEASVEAIVTDPPYGLGFMGKEWDDLPPGLEWAQECIRVLKPGGHLLAFGGSRTYHRLACAVEDAGFEIRDQIMWLYGSGFPKSLNVGKAIDKRGGSVAGFASFRDAVRDAMNTNGVTRKELQSALGNHMLSHYLTAGSQPAVPNLRDYKVIRDTVGLGNQFDELFCAEAEREVVGKSSNKSGIGNAADGHYTVGGTQAEHYDLTIPATPEAEQWEGWGTALKPAHEPIVVARKPLSGTVAANVLEFGTGALNIDGCRIGTTVETWPSSRSYAPGQIQPGGKGETEATGPVPAGRWPANVILDEEAGRLLDEQSGELTGAKPYVRSQAAEPGLYAGHIGEVAAGQVMNGYGGSGGASRFFYCPKASKGERNAGLDGFEEKMPRGLGVGDNAVGKGRGSKSGPRANHHPTVKPIELMRYLCRLVTPPGGTVLDPFTGSGTTGCAAVLEGFDFIGVEREAEYAEIVKARIAWWEKHQAQGDTDDIMRAAGEREETEQAGQLGLLDEAA